MAFSFLSLSICSNFRYLHIPTYSLTLVSDTSYYLLATIQHVMETMLRGVRETDGVRKKYPRGVENKNQYK